MPRLAANRAAAPTNMTFSGCTVNISGGNVSAAQEDSTNTLGTWHDAGRRAAPVQVLGAQQAGLRGSMKRKPSPQMKLSQLVDAVASGDVTTTSSGKLVRKRSARARRASTPARRLVAVRAAAGRSSARQSVD